MARKVTRPGWTPDLLRPVRRRWQNITKQRHLALPAQRRRSSSSPNAEEGRGEEGSIFSGRFASAKGAFQPQPRPAAWESSPSNSKPCMGESTMPQTSPTILPGRATVSAPPRQANTGKYINDYFASSPLVIGKREVVAKRQRRLASYEVAGSMARKVMCPEWTPDFLRPVGSILPHRASPAISLLENSFPRKFMKLNSHLV
jgi:hypothetical protein